ncbi:MAG: FHA domain-containing protein [Chitinispirillia bacterium]|nr:FHA domain-containing protein [Chitinispirillia bacterium]MCL2241415.1 FHA domain-containing protein [Chitinispirillia bacterium]
MTRYTVYFNGEQVKSYELDEPVIFIGRLPENHIPISNMGISRRHVKIELDPSGSYSLSDLNSLNGTLVNGKKVKKVVLFHGDKITIGKYTILYEDFRGGPGAAHLETILADVKQDDMRRMAIAAGIAPPASATAAPFPGIQSFPAAPTPVDIPVDAPIDMSVAQFNEAAGRQGGAAAADDAQTVPVFIETAGHVVYKLDRTYLTIGSDDEDDIYVNGFMVSKGFAAIEQRHDGKFHISGLKVMSKFKVNGKNMKTHKLKHGDRIEIGSNTFRYMENGKRQ